MHCIGGKKPRRPSVDSDTQLKANNEQRADRHLDIQAEVPPTENQQFWASSSWSDDCGPVFPPTVLNEEASVSDSMIAHSEDDLPRAPTDPNQELCHTGQHKGPLAPLVAAIESPQCQHHAGKMLELYCSSHEQPVCLLCASTSHRRCDDIETLDEAVEERSEDLVNLVKTLKDKEDSLAWQTPDQEYEPHSTVLRDKPYGADLSNMLQVGQRVKRCLDTVGLGLGTVTAVPSARIATRGGDPYGLVDVCWDAGGVGCYRMGRFGHYELELA
ncbi:hypothetical protein ACOMHN_038543 [Nucella lapillus]